ncbi:hypothetical protein EPUL_000225 [Erysiphe pulchra]|uniref:Reverse transcriptase domain-containing protein n=1 Tax=Erysiphe pulchra TaxID=225359 RepID=A0A2S4Q134_9PEZI|nr:hypothetical protein EPUL_000225 [Erysiphe pulchra]
MAPPARDKKCGVSDTLDPKRRIQKSANNTGGAQSRATTLTRSVEKANVVVEKIATPTMDIDTEWDSERELESDNFPPSNHKPHIENEIDNITQNIHTALLFACSRASCKQRGAVWWNGECRDAAYRYCEVRQTGQSNYEKRELLNAIRRVEREYWKSRVEKLDTLPDVYKIVKWHNTAPKHHTPPLKDPNDETDVFCQKRRWSFFTAVAARNILWRSLTEAEAFRATFQISSLSPGEDKITAPILRIAWSSLGNCITHLFNKCAVIGVHPRSFRRAEIDILPKPGKRDRNLPKSYCPISLLSWLGKGLERLQILSGPPQVPPTSLILFLLYMEPILGLSRGRFGYADDILIFETACTLEKCGKRLQASLNLTLRWGLEKGVQF